MSKAATSPTARLLQSSRLFSLPRPLPAPLNDSLTSTGSYRGSDTATLPFPTHQAITTPAFALHRGDFGLKRSLPSKTTKRTSTPHVRVLAQDTYEHITDFVSAADHTLTERKWGELEIPIVQRPPPRYEARRKSLTSTSVYEEWLDNTDPDVKPAISSSFQDGGRLARPAKQMQRWKYTGPWVAGMEDGEFNKWLDRTIARRKAEWRELLRKKEVDKRTAELQAQARDRGESLSLAELARIREEQRPTDVELADIEKDLRDGFRVHKLSSDLTALLAEFLDLPSIVHSAGDSRPQTATAEMGQELSTFVETASTSTQAPPTTHPGAGLSHLRTNAIMANHPLWGPQISSSPVPARVVRPRRSANGSVQNAKLGVAGFVADDSHSATFTPRSAGPDIPEDDRLTEYMDENVEGGNKIWVQARKAYVDDKGLVRLEVARADQEALAVRRGGKELDAIVEAKAASATARRSRPSIRGPVLGRAFGL